MTSKARNFGKVLELASYELIEFGEVHLANYTTTLCWQVFRTAYEELKS